MSNYQIATFYRFMPLAKESLDSLQQQIHKTGQDLNLIGLLLIGCEGLNATIAGSAAAIVKFELWLNSYVHDGLELGPIEFKRSQALQPPFHDWKVQLRPEIVSLGRPDLVPSKSEFHHLSPQEWHQAMQAPDTIVLDTRNDYEIEVGHFRGSRDLALKTFHEFPEKLRAADLPKDKKYLIYCTGGIRCEKAILEMHEQGYTDVHQLRGGILEYLRQFPNQEFVGDCFVFDYRVAVNQELQPSGRYSLCPHCGQPSNVRIDCAQCGRSELICQHCYDQSEDLRTCTKNCAHHFRLRTRSRKIHQAEIAKRQPRAR